MPEAKGRASQPHLRKAKRAECDGGARAAWSSAELGLCDSLAWRRVAFLTPLFALRPKSVPLYPAGTSECRAVQAVQAKRQVQAGTGLLGLCWDLLQTGEASGAPRAPSFSELQFGCYHLLSQSQRRAKTRAGAEAGMDSCAGCPRCLEVRRASIHCCNASNKQS